MKYLLAFGFVCLLYFQPVGSQSSFQGESQRITDALLEAESKRLTNPALFSSNLKSLANDVPLMSGYQMCHYEFLLSYEKIYRGETDQASIKLLDLLKTCEDLRVRIRVNAMLSNLFVIRGDYRLASIHIDNVIQNAEQTADYQSRVLAYSVASIVYEQLNQKELGAKYAQLLHALEPTGTNQCKATYYKYVHMFETDPTKVNNDEVAMAVNQCKESNITIQGLFLKVKHAEFRVNQLNQNKTLASNLVTELNQVENEVMGTGYKNLQAIYYSTLSYLNLIANDLKSAEDNALKSNDLNQGLGNSKQYIQALQVLEAVSRSKDDYQGAYKYLAQRSDAEKAMYDVNQSKQMAYMTVKHANLARVFEIEQLNQQNSVLELEKQLARQEANNQKLIILLILTVLGFLILWMMKIKKRHDYFKGVSEIDHLTKVLTRKAFEEQMSVLLEQSQDGKRPLHVAIMDLDNFKDVNDNHGHLIGDWVLKNVIYACKELVEENMLIARLGGEEFCVAMVDVDYDVMINKIEAMRLAIEGLDCSDSGAELSVTASFGVTSSVTSGYSLPLLLTHADVALFEAKKKGRNQVVKFKVLKAR